jgi:hypothetical protein
VIADALTWWADYSYIEQFPSVTNIAAHYQSMRENLINEESVQSTNLEY